MKKNEEGISGVKCSPDAQLEENSIGERGRAGGGKSPFLTK